MKQFGDGGLASTLLPRFLEPQYSGKPAQLFLLNINSAKGNELSVSTARFKAVLQVVGHLTNDIRVGIFRITRTLSPGYFVKCLHSLNEKGAFHCQS